LNNYTILIMEDNEDINLLTKTTLAYKQYNVLSAFNGKEGIKMANDNKIDLIILDVMMPDMDGYEVLQVLKSCNATKNIPVVFFSAKTQEEEIKRGLRLGAIKYFTKPFDPVTFLNEVEQLLLMCEKNK